MRAAGSVLGGGGGAPDPESVAAWLEDPIDLELAVTGASPFTVIDVEIPTGFFGYMTWDLCVSGGSAATPIGGYISGGRSGIRHTSSGTLTQPDVGVGSIQADGTTLSYSAVPSGGNARVTLTLGTSTTVRVTGWLRIYGGLIE